jgi:cyclopropane fatty-acyl-phospholipid synthase-like methyltransferase
MPVMASDYWRSAADDEAMQDDHGFIWEALLDTIDVDPAGKRVLDAGCNRGGFLRLLVDRCGIAEGLGYDPAAGAIEDARRLAGSSTALRNGRVGAEGMARLRPRLYVRM